MKNIEKGVSRISFPQILSLAAVAVFFVALLVASSISGHVPFLWVVG